MGKLSDLNMLVMAGGCERTEQQYSALLREAGFRLSADIRASTAHHWVLEALPVRL